MSIQHFPACWRVALFELLSRKFCIFNYKQTTIRLSISEYVEFVHLRSKLEFTSRRNWIRKIGFQIKKQHWKVLKQLRTYVFPPFFTFEMKTSQLGSGENFNRIRFLVLKVCFSKNVCLASLQNLFRDATWMRYVMQCLLVFFNSQKPSKAFESSFHFPFRKKFVKLSMSCKLR